MISPATVQELAQTVQQAAAAKQKLRIAGTQSLRARCPPPPAGARVLSVAGLDRIEIDAQNLVARVDGGVRLDCLWQALDGAGLVWPVERLEPGGTVGGLVASGRGAGRRPGDAPARRWILGAQIVLGDGSLVTVGGATVKNSVGYDFTHATWGSCGRLGAIVHLTLRLRHPPDDDGATARPAPPGALEAVLASPVEVRCEEIPAGWSATELATRAGGGPVALSADGSRALMGFDETATARSAVERLTALGCFAALDRPPEPRPREKGAAGLLWRALRSAVDPAGVLV